jgi:3-oxoacyl-[acyl-carrier-protein] synthase II
MAFSADMIRQGQADLVLTGGVDAAVTPLTLASFSLSGLLPWVDHHPDRMSRPFDLHRKGGILAEGAGVFVMESLGHALARGATPLAEVRGYGNQGDAPRSEAGSGLGEAMEEALWSASLTPGDVEYINAHGPSDPIIDRVETAVIKRTFGKRAGRIPVSSIKGVVGNPLSAAGPMQVGACLLGMRDNIVPPTANYETPDPWCDLDYVPNQGYSVGFDRAMINLHGLGGGNSCLVVERVRSA